MLFAPILILLVVGKKYPTIATALAGAYVGFCTFHFSTRVTI